MNKKIGMYASIINVCAVIAFAFCMLIGNDFGSYLVCMFIAFSFVPMICTFTFIAVSKRKLLEISQWYLQECTLYLFYSSILRK